MSSNLNLMEQKENSNADCLQRLVRPPRRLYLQWNGAWEPEETPVCEEEVTWCRDKIWPHDLEYVLIPKDNVSVAGCLNRTADNLRLLAGVQVNKKMADDLRGFANEIMLIAARTVA
jgi:hypothetical protein